MSETASPLTWATSERLQEILSGDPTPARLVAALRHLAKWRSELLGNTLAVRSGTRVISGPFAGMDYPVRASEGSRSARLLGTYEASLWPVIESIIARAYDLVIDLGSAEGYYAVGLAKRMHNTRILACDQDPAAQGLCQMLAVANGVAGQISVKGHMGPEELDICRKQNTVVICDIEGEEEFLIDPENAPGLLCADILVEVHDSLRPGLSQVIAERFAATHQITRIGRKIDDTGLPDWMEELSDLDRLIALWEWRSGPTPWLWIERK